MILLAALLLQDVQVPVQRQPSLPGPPPVAANLSLVIADTIDQVDPRPLCAQPGCTALFLGAFKNGRTLAGSPMPAAFKARLEMGSPFLSPYRLALIVERRAGGESLVRATAGFNVRTGIGCFQADDTKALGWTPSGPGISIERGIICVKE